MIIKTLNSISYGKELGQNFYIALLLTVNQ